MASGSISGPVPEVARGPLPIPNRYHSFPPFFSLTSGPHRSVHIIVFLPGPKISPETRPSPPLLLPSIPLYSLLNSAPLCAYLIPSSSSPFPLWFPSSTPPGCLRIAHRSSFWPPPSACDSDATRWPRRQLLVPFSFSWLCVPPWHLLWIFTASNRPPRTNPKLTSTRLTSGHHSTPLLETIGPADHAPKLPSLFCIPPTPPSSPGSPRTSLAILSSVQTRRWRPKP
jgi:hypothetical protein